MKHEFKPAWWLPGAHLQTIIPAIFRRKHDLPLLWQTLELNDGDFLDLAWIGIGNGPIVLVLHGLNGSINSGYANGIMHAINKRGWRGVLMHFRGCSGKPNRLARSYHSGETGDLNNVIKVIRDSEPTTPLFAVGYSLGGNVLLKALGEGKNTAQLSAAVAVSVPFELAETAEHLSKGFRKVYQHRLVKELKKSHKNKFSQMPLPVKPANLAAIKTFWEFDNAITGPLHGFKGADDYYQLSSSRQYLDKIEVPTLILHARNDPFTKLNSLPDQSEVSNAVTIEYTAAGGHVGFVSGIFPWKPIYWLEDRILNYFAEILTFESSKSR